MEKIDKRKHYVLVVDTETANTIQDGDSLDMSNVLVYDCGWAVVDTKGNIYETASYVNRDIFCEERDLMRTAYYNWKSPAMSRNCGQVAERWQAPMKSARLCWTLSRSGALKR